MALPSVIPIFPLPNVVLFPRVALPLHIFEPRYRKMTADALAAHKTIGMTLLRPGWEQDYEGRPPIYAIGGAGTIERWEQLEGGRYNILLRGVTRFRILEEHAGEPYRLASVVTLEDLPGDAEDLAEPRREVLKAIGRAADGPAVLVLQVEQPPDIFINSLSLTLEMSPVERQSLLECDSIPARYRRLIEILEFLRLERTYGDQRPPKVH